MRARTSLRLPQHCLPDPTHLRWCGPQGRAFLKRSTRRTLRHTLKTEMRQVLR